MVEQPAVFSGSPSPGGLAEKWGESNYVSNRSITELAWLAGILDGEGCLTVKPTGSHSVACVVTVETVSLTMIRKIEAVLSGHGVCFRKEGPLMRPRSTRPSVRIRVDTKRAVLRFCELVLPYSVVKRPELLLFKGYLEKSCSVTYYRASEEDLRLVTQVKQLKRLA